MKIIRPNRPRIIARVARLATRNEPVRLVSMTAYQSSSLIRISRVSRVIPALATSDLDRAERGLHLGEGGVHLRRDR